MQRFIMHETCLIYRSLSALIHIFILYLLMNCLYVHTYFKCVWSYVFAMETWRHGDNVICSRWGIFLRCPTAVLVMIVVYKEIFVDKDSAVVWWGVYCCILLSLLRSDSIRRLVYLILFKTINLMLKNY